MKLRSTIFAIAGATAALVAAAPAFAAPPNDTFPGTTIGPTLPITVTGTTLTATAQAGEPDHPDDGGAVASIWYEWVAPATQSVRISTCDSDSDAHLGVYTGATVNAPLVNAAANDGGCVYTFAATMGMSYKIAIDGHFDPGPTELFLRAANPPANDPFANPIALAASGSIAVSGTTVDATREGGEDDPNDSGGSVWYSWTPASSGVAVFSTCTSTGDPTLTVYTGAPTMANAIVANDDACNTGSSLGSGVSFNAVGGTPYSIAVAALGGPSTEGTFTLRNVPAVTTVPVTPVTPVPVTTVPVTPVTPSKKCKKGFKKVKGKCKKVKRKKKK